MNRRLALIVDDEPINCMIIQAILEDMGFDTAVAHDGDQAIEAFELLAPDFVFMDVIMPRLDGREAARRIKSRNSGCFTPIIFLTALDDPQEVYACIEAGGDDYLRKPVDPQLLRTRIYSLERIRSLYQKLRLQHDELLLKLAAEEENEALANRVFLHAVSSHNEPLLGLESFSRPASCFSGDLVLSCRLPQGGLRLLLGDFTGHGLAAALGALPVSELFHAMSRRGSSMLELLSELNQKLCRLLPDDRFMAAILMEIDITANQVSYWSGGMPRFVYKAQDQLHYLPSSGLPLGILEDYDFASDVQVFDSRHVERILLMSDGLLDVCNQEGQMFSDCGFDTFIESWHQVDDFFPILNQMLDQHCQHQLPDDDITLVSIDLKKIAQSQLDEDQSHAALVAVRPPIEGWQWSLTSGGRYLLDHVEIVRLLVSSGYFETWPASEVERFQTLFGELYNNAVEHGLLGLESSLKSSPQGFDLYYAQRQQLLAAPPSGQIHIDMAFQPTQQGGCLRVVIQDTGRGYDAQCLAELTRLDDPLRLWGRGMQLVKQLADDLIIHPPGNKVEVVLRWSH